MPKIDKIKDADEFYKPRIKKDVKIDGIAAETVEDGGVCKMIQKDFIFSSQDNFEQYSNNILAPFLDPFSKNEVNNLLVIIGKDHTARIYTKFPQILKIRSKIDVKKGDPVLVEDIVDIEELKFSDSVQDIAIEEGDQIIWFFRVGLKFGLYFDLTRTLKPETLPKNLGQYYRFLLYYNLYSFL